MLSVTHIFVSFQFSQEQKDKNKFFFKKPYFSHLTGSAQQQVPEELQMEKTPVMLIVSHLKDFKTCNPRTGS